MRRSYRFRLQGTVRQYILLVACLRDHCLLYNAALEERREWWLRNAETISYFGQAAQLKYIRQDSAEQKRWSAASQQATLRQLDKAFQAFFRRVKAGEAPGYPRFKSAARWDSVTWPTNGDGCKWKPENNQVYFKGVGTLKVLVHRPVEGIVKTLQVKREGRHWYLILSCDQVPTKPLPATGKIVGIDLGITEFLATSDGELVSNPRHGRRGADKLAYAQRVLARKKRGSSNRRAAVTVVANRHRKIANQRRDFHHQTARRLINKYDLIVLEDLKIKNMSRSASGTLDTPGTNVAAKSGLNRSILDAGWGQLRHILTDKAEEADRQVVVVNPQYTSQTCPECGHVSRENRHGVEFLCLNCGHSGHADIVAAENILRVGLTHLAAQVA